MALPIPGLRSIPLPRPPSPPVPPVPVPLPNRALVPALRRLELVVWALCVVLTTAFVAVAITGAFVVASQPLTLPLVSLLTAVVAGTVGFVVADLLFE
jgi:hypothetical protein